MILEIKVTPETIAGQTGFLDTMLQAHAAQGYSRMPLESTLRMWIETIIANFHMEALKEKELVKLAEQSNDLPY